MGLVLVMKVQGVEKKFHSGSFSSTFSFWWHPKDWGGFWAGFSACFQVQEGSTCWALQSQWGLTCNSGQNWGLCGQRRKISNTLLFLFQSRKDPSRREVCDVSQLQRHSTSLAEDLHASVRSVPISWISIFHCRVTLSLCGIVMVDLQISLCL